MDNEYEFPFVEQVSFDNGESLSDSKEELNIPVEVLSSVETFTYDFSPQFFVPGYGEGGMDTAVVVEGGVRRSIQRTGYFELVNADGGRKVVEVYDGETVTDEVEVPETTSNPNGHPTFGSGDVPSITEQVIPTGNPLVS